MIDIYEMVDIFQFFSYWPILIFCFRRHLKNQRPKLSGIGNLKLFHMSQLRAGGPVIPGLTSSSQVQTWLEHAPSSYGNPDCYGDEYYFYFMGGHARASPKGGRSCSLGTRNY